MGELGAIEPVCRPPRRSTEVVKALLVNGVGLEQPGQPTRGGWTAVTALRRAELLQKKFSNKILKVPSEGAVRNWLKAETPVSKNFRGLLDRMLFFDISRGSWHECEERDELWRAWDQDDPQLGKPESTPPPAQASGVPPVASEIRGKQGTEVDVDLDPPKWDREESWGTPRLAAHGMADPLPQGNSDNGNYRIVGEPIVNVVEAERKGRYVRVGVNNVQVLVESTAYDIQPNSRVTEKVNKPRIEMVADGVHVHAREPDAPLNGPLWDYGDVVVVQKNADPDGPIEVTLRAGRRSFLVAEVDRSGRETRVQEGPEETAIIEMILRKDPEIDGLGDHVLAKIRWRRAPK